MPFGGLLTAGLISGGASILGGVIGNIASEGDRNAAAAAQKKAAAEIAKLGAGPDLAKQIYLREFKSAGVLTPELEKAVDQGVSKVAQIQEDPRFKKAQMEALAGIQQRGRTGFTAEERAQLSQERAAAERSAEAKRQQILSGLRARGALDSGAGIAAQLQSADELAAQQQAAAERGSASASQRALQAMMQGGELAGRVRGQEFDVSRTKAGAEDEFQRFNIQNRMAQEQRRVGMENQTRQYNLGQQQQLMNMNIQQQNAEMMRQRQAQQEMYNNQVRLAQLRAGTYGQQAAQAQQQAAQTQQGWAQMGSAVGQAAGAIGQAAMNEPLRQAQIGYYNTQAGLNPDGSPSWQIPSSTSPAGGSAFGPLPQGMSSQQNILNDQSSVFGPLPQGMRR
jgi:hypothetical protein